MEFLKLTGKYSGIYITEGFGIIAGFGLMADGIHVNLASDEGKKDHSNL